MSDKYVFIGGVGRSGTSIVKELLSSNQTVAAFPFEYRFIIDPDGIIDYLMASVNGWSPYIADKRLKRLESLLLRLGKKRRIPYFLGELIRSGNFLRKYITADSYHGWELQEHFPNYYKHVATLISELEEFQFTAIWAGADSFRLNHKIKYSPPKDEDELYFVFSRFLKTLFHDFLEKREKQILIEDNTWNLLFTAPLSKLFPGSKFIHIYRDPRDVVCSYCKQRWMPSNLSQSAIICRDLYLQIFKNMAGLNKQEVFELSLEKLVSDQKKSVLSMASFVDMEASQDMLQFPLSNSSIGRWKKDLNKSQLLELEPILKDITEKLGYAW